jgi:hypothetical protein
MSENLDRIAARIAQHMNAIHRQQHGTAAQATWTCEDNWAVIYTTTRVVGGPHDGSFVAQLFRPEGNQWVQDDRRVCATRKEAKARAVKWYREHSPKWNARNPAAKA